MKLCGCFHSPTTLQSGPLVGFGNSISTFKSPSMRPTCLQLRARCPRLSLTSVAGRDFFPHGRVRAVKRKPCSVGSFASF